MVNFFRVGEKKNLTWENMEKQNCTMRGGKKEERMKEIRECTNGHNRDYL